MNKFIKSLIVSALLLALYVVQIAFSKHPFNNLGLLSMGLTMVIVIGVPVVVWIEMKRLKQGKPMVDELSKMIALKANSTAYYISIFTWGTALGVSEYLKFNNLTFFAIGISLMIVTGLLSGVYYKIKGVKDE